MMRLVLIIWLGCMASISLTISQVVDQEPLHQLQATTLNVLTDSLNYEKTHRVLRLKESLNIPEIEEEPEPQSTTSLNLGGLLKTMAYVAIAALIGTLLYLLIGQIKADKKIELTTINTDDIEDIEDVNARNGYEEALLKGDYRSAIRMQCILVLQHLSERKKIDWQINKTNRDYSRELRATEYFNSFSSLSNIYEWVWYGHTEITEPIFDQVNEEFIAFIKRYIPTQTP